MSRLGAWTGLLGFLAMTGAGVLIAGALLGRPDAAGGAAPDPGAGLRVQHVIAQLVLRQEGLSRQRDPLILTTDDVNAFLARHVRVRDIPAWPPVVQLLSGSATLTGRTSPRRLLGAGRGAWLLEVTPSALLDLEVWLAVRGRLDVQAGHGEFVVEGAGIGRQPIPVTWLWWLLGARPAELVGWRMPPIVERLEIQPGRLVIRTRGG